MTPQRPAGIGAAPYISAGALAIFFVIQQFGGVIAQAIPAIELPMENVFLLSLWVWAAALAVSLARLDRAAGQRMNMRTRVARLAGIVSVVMPVPLAIGGYLGVRELLPVSYALTFLGAGVSLLIRNIDGREAGSLSGVVPWLGVATALGFVIGGLGFGASLVSMDAFVAGYNVLGVTEVSYVAWAIWVGLRQLAHRPIAAAPA